jgi:hypothetical protein
MHPFSITASGAIVSEAATPAGTCVAVSHWPSQGAGASNEALDPPGMLHAFVLAVSVDGSAQDPVGGSQVHASHALGATRSSCPSQKMPVGPVGHSGAWPAGPDQSNVGPSQ